MKQLLKYLKPIENILKSVVILFAVTVIAFTCFIMIPTLLATRSSANEVGKGTGYAVGKVIGSWKGLMDAGKAFDDKANSETSAEDTKVNIAEIRSGGKLEVLIVNQKLGNFIRVGSKGDIVNQEKDDPSTKNVSYAILQVTPVEGVFSVDLSNAEITVSEKNCEILLGRPTVEITKFSDDREILAEFKNLGLFTKAAEIGDKAMTNAEIKTMTEAKKFLSEDEELMKRAEKSAEKQVEILVKAICGKEYSVNVKFRA